MKTRMDRTQAALVYVRVDLRGGNIGMSQHLLDHAQWRAVGQQMTGKRMAQGMR